MDLDWRASAADAKFDDPLRPLRPVSTAAFFFGLVFGHRCNLAIDALQPHGMPHLHSVESGLSSALGRARTGRDGVPSILSVALPRTADRQARAVTLAERRLQTRLHSYGLINDLVPVLTIRDA
ncbi:hypothetical protein [Streptomyces griseus]|uniref:hypothetical protein n=1 Tax=Streptomyces griseus TaxID=1911 RepID=UPI00131A90F8|nr:hypothetical protein [Streptomyces griseus]